MRQIHPNHTIIVNWSKRGFGCRKRCSYCQWRSSPHLPHGGQAADAVTAFITQCKKSFITISGGADPLYRLDENRPALLEMIGTIRDTGYRPRLITREIAAIASVKDELAQVSISLDAETLAQVEHHRHQWRGLDVEYSLVLPPVPQETITRLMPQYKALQQRIRGRLALRENLNSIFPLDPGGFMPGDRQLVFVPKGLCLNSRYLLSSPFAGHELIQDMAPIAQYLMHQQGIYLFGGFVKHLIDPLAHSDYGDIDLIVLDTNVITELETKFGYQFTATSPSGAYPSYYHGQPTKAGKPLQVILLNSPSDAFRFVFNAQYDIDRVLYTNGAFHFDPAIGEQTTLHGITSKLAATAPGPQDRTLFQFGRAQVELRHKVKLLRKGFTINPSPTSS